MLNIRLLDCLVQRASPPLPAMPSKKVVLGGLSTRSYMATCNALLEGDGVASLSHDKMKQIEKIRSRFENVFDLDNDCVNRFIIPACMVCISLSLLLTSTRPALMSSSMLTSMILCTTLHKSRCTYSYTLI